MSRALPLPRTDPGLISRALACRALVAAALDLLAAAENGTASCGDDACKALLTATRAYREQLKEST